MSGKDKPPSIDDPIKNIIQDAFGMSSRECLNEFAEAEEHPDLSLELRAPSDGYQRIKDKIKLENIPSASEAYNRKVIRLRRILRPLVAAAIVGSVVWGFGIGASGHKFYGYRPFEEASDRSDVVWDSDDALIKVNSENEAYAKIKEKLGIQVIQLSYIPYEMKFENLSLYKESGVIGFSYEDKEIFLVQAKANIEWSKNYSSDHSKREEVFNEWIKKTIDVHFNTTQKGNKEVEAKVEVNGVVYYLIGTMESEETFLNIVRGLKL